MKNLALLTLAILLSPILRAQDPDQVVNPEMQRQEVVNLEYETVRAIQQNNGTFFRRVYGDDFYGTLHGQAVDKAALIRVIEDRSIRYEFFNASDIKVHIFQETAVATCLWTSQYILKGQRISTQLRVIHVYVNGARGWKAVASQTTNLPPDSLHPL